MRRGGQNTRQAIFEAATAEFAARGFAGAGVDRIARRAGVNKAMIYYHFKSKARLYSDIVRGMFAAIAARTSAVASSPLSPGDKINGFIEAIVAEAGARPYMPPIMMREAAEGGRHLDPAILRTILGVFGSLRTILDEGASTRVFKHVDPVLMYFTLVGPIVMYLASAPVRSAIGHLAKTGGTGIDPSPFTGHLNALRDVAALRDHLKAAARHTLDRRPTQARPGKTQRPRTIGRRRAAGRSGEQA